MADVAVMEVAETEEITRAGLPVVVNRKFADVPVVPTEFADTAS